MLDVMQVSVFSAASGVIHATPVWVFTRQLWLVCGAENEKMRFFVFSRGFCHFASMKFDMTNTYFDFCRFLPNGDIAKLVPSLAKNFRGVNASFVKHSGFWGCENEKMRFFILLSCFLKGFGVFLPSGRQTRRSFFGNKTRKSLILKR